MFVNLSFILCVTSCLGLGAWVRSYLLFGRSALSSKLNITLPSGSETNNTGMTVNNNRLTCQSVSLQPGLQRYRSEIHKKVKYIRQSYAHWQVLLNILYLPRHIWQINLCEEMSLGWIHLCWMTEQLPYVGPAGNLRAVSLFPLRWQPVKSRLKHGGPRRNGDREALPVETAKSKRMNVHAPAQRYGICLMWPASSYVTLCCDTLLPFISCYWGEMCCSG